MPLTLPSTAQPTAAPDRAADPPPPAPRPARVFDLIAHQLRTCPRPDALAAKTAGGEWRRYPTAEVVETARNLAAALHELGIGPGDRVANVTETNRPEWNFVDLAVMSLGAVHVPVYPTLTAAEFRFILHDSGAKLAFASSPALRAKILSVQAELPALEAVYTYDPPSDPADPGAGRPWSALRDAGAAARLRQPGLDAALDRLAAAVRPEDLATIIYTSGTTGEPKGVMLSHANLVSNCLACAALIGTGPAERALSFLPLCHIFERTVLNLYLYSGTAVYYAENLEQVGANLREVRPHVFTTVPRLLEKVYERILARGATLRGPGRRLFAWAVALAKRLDPENAGAWSPLDRWRLAAADRLVFRRWREALGGRVRAVISGSAALNPVLARVFWNAGIPVYEGYGPTEAAPVISVNRLEPGAHRIGTVGPVIPGGEVRLAADGEILYRGPNVMVGYHGRPDLTAAAVDAEGFLHTGDVGEFETGPGGRQFLKITDRKKEIFKTSGGKYIAPQPLENQLKSCSLVAQAMVVGEFRKFPGALVVPNFPVLRQRLAAAGETPGSDEELVRSPAARSLVQAEIDGINREIARYAQIKNFVLLPQEWSVARGELTPTLKLRRREILQRYAAQVEAIYAESARPGDR